MMGRGAESTQGGSSAASEVYRRQEVRVYTVQQPDFARPPSHLVLGQPGWCRFQEKPLELFLEAASWAHRLSHEHRSTKSASRCFAALRISTWEPGVVAMLGYVAVRSAKAPGGHWSRMHSGGARAAS